MNPGRQIKILLILMTGALILAGCAKTTAITMPAPIYGHSTGEVRTPITVLLILSQAPRLDEPAQVTLVVTSTLDAPGTTAEILLPPGAVATGGALTWTGDLQAQQPRQLAGYNQVHAGRRLDAAGQSLASSGGTRCLGRLSRHLPARHPRGRPGRFPERVECSAHRRSSVTYDHGDHTVEPGDRFTYKQLTW